MGQTQIQLKQNQDYRLIQQLPVGNIVKHNKTQSLHFLKQYSFTAQQAYQNALNMHSLKLANKNQHILNFLHFTTKSENSFCSSFHKIILIFEYTDYSLEKQIANRIRDGHPFNQKQIWSILCSCVLAAVHLVHTEGKMHCGLTSRDIRLSLNGCVKLLSHQMIGIDFHHNQNEGLPKTLAATLIQCINMQKISTQETKYLQTTIEGLDCSKQMKQMLQMMIKNDVTFLELEQHLFKLVQDDQSLASHSNTPILKPQSPLTSSDYKCPRIVHNDNKSKNYPTQIKQSKIQPMQADNEDLKSYVFMTQQSGLQIQNPDQTEQQTNQQTIQQASPQSVNEFYLKQKKYQSNPKLSDLKAEQLNKIQKIFTKRQYQINPVQSSRRKQSNQNFQQNNRRQNSNQVNFQMTSSSQNQANLFTDPKLFSLIKSDLEQIKMRRSIGQLGFQKISQPSKFIIQPPVTYKSTQYQTFNQNHLQVPQKSTQIIRILPQENKQTGGWFKENQAKLQTSKSQANITNSNNYMKQIQMIRQVSQEYREQQQETKQRLNSKQTTKQLQQKKEQQFMSEKAKSDRLKKEQNVLQQQRTQNIMNDTGIGFRKKKQQTAKFQIPKQNSQTQSQTNTINNGTHLNNKSKQNIQPSKIQSKFSPKSKTVGMKPVQPEKNTHFMRHDQFFNQYANSQTSQPISSQSSSRMSSNRNQRAEKDTQKLIHVSEKYTRGHYQGTKLNGKRHGFGTFFYSQGGKYVGNWRQNKMHGKGILYYPSQKVAYDGQWQNDQLSGYGTLYNQQVTVLRTPFDYRDWTDAQDYWVKYQGHFYQDNKQGQGKLYLVNGQRLEAEFHDDKVDGEGILYRGDGNSVKGKWRQNKLIRMF